VAGVVFVNPQAGPDETSLGELKSLFAGHAVEPCPPEELADRVAAAGEDSVDFVGVAGGDGTLRCAAGQLLAGDVPLLAVPAGTRNHFAKDLGIRTLDDAAAAAVEGSTIAVDVGCVSGHVFLNNSSIGVYPRIVIRREAREHRLRKGVATVVAAVEQIRRGRRMTVEVDGDTGKAWLVFVGNGRYGEGLLDLADRESLYDHLLDVRVVSADRPMARLRVVGALLLGRLAGSPLVDTRETTAVTIDVPRRRSVEVALDGEIEHLEPPLRYESLPGALKVLAPRA
jgi:undecaprenyl-diphosphatase